MALFSLSLPVFETRYHYVAQAGLELTILLSSPPECWDYRCAPLHPDMLTLFFFVVLGVALFATQVCYHLSHTPSHFSYLLNRVFSLWWGQRDCKPPIYDSCVVGFTGVCHHAQLLFEIGSREVFAQADLEP
jgi:hypothetical protein